MKIYEILSSKFQTRERNICIFWCFEATVFLVSITIIYHTNLHACKLNCSLVKVSRSLGGPKIEKRVFNGFDKKFKLILWASDELNSPLTSFLSCRYSDCGYFSKTSTLYCMPSSNTA